MKINMFKGNVFKASILIASSYLSLSSSAFANECESSITFGDTLNSSWVSECQSTHRTDYNDPYNPQSIPAKFYTFSVNEETDVKVEIYGGFGQQLFLLDGSSPHSPVRLGWQGNLIETTLPAGTYTIEATAESYSDFELSLSDNTSGTIQCNYTIDLSQSITEGWTPNCLSQHRTNNDPYNGDDQQFRAKYFTFNIAESQDINITVNSSQSTYLYLLEGSTEFGTPILQSGNGSINTSLAAGDYTIELTPYYIGETGTFTVQVDPVQSSVCEQDITVTNSQQTFSGGWSANCLIQSDIPGNQDPYSGINPERANYYSFSLNEEKDVTFSNIYNQEGLVLTLYHAGNFDHIIESTKPTDWWSDVTYSFTAPLVPGEYVLEVTKYNQLAIGNYDFAITGQAIEPCSRPVAIGEYISGQLDNRCLSEFRGMDNSDPYSGHGGTFYAKQVEFVLDAPKHIELNANIQDGYTYSYVYLAEKTPFGNRVVDESYSENYWQGSNSRSIVRTIPAGTYIAEVTTQDQSYSSVPYSLTLQQNVQPSCFDVLDLNTLVLSSVRDQYNHYDENSCKSAFKQPIYNWDPYSPDSGYQYFYAQAFSFKIEQAGDYDVVVSAQGFNSEVILLKGQDLRGEILTQQVAIGENKLHHYLEPGYYTVEITTENVERQGEFSIYVHDGVSPIDGIENPCIENIDPRQNQTFTGKTLPTCNALNSPGTGKTFEFELDKFARILTKTKVNEKSRFFIYKKNGDEWQLIRRSITLRAKRKQTVYIPLRKGVYRIELATLKPNKTTDFKINWKYRSRK